MKKDDATRVLRTEPLQISDVVLLPVGVSQPGEENVRYRKVVIDDMSGVDEHNLANAKIRKNPSLAQTIILRRCVQEIEGLVPRKKDPNALLPAEPVCDWMTQVDRDLLTIAILCLSGKDTTDVRGYCADCDEQIEKPVSLSDLKVYDWPEGEPLFVTGELPRGVREDDGNVAKQVQIRFPTGKLVEHIYAQARNNAGKIRTLTIATCVELTDSEDGMDSEVAMQLKLVDRRHLGKLMDKQLPGIQLTHMLECEGCGNTDEVDIDMSGFFSEASSR